MKQGDVLTWDEHFTRLAYLSARWSKDPSTQVGTVIVSNEYRVTSIGYNGFPNGCSNDEFSWDRKGDFGNAKYPYIMHTELNAILSSKYDLKGCSIHMSLFSCSECVKMIIQSGISRIVYESDKYAYTGRAIASKRMLHSMGIELVQLPYAIDLRVSRKISPTIR